MNRSQPGFLAAVAQTFILPEPVGLWGDVPQAWVWPRRYVRIHHRPARGVDVVGSIEQLPLANGVLGSFVVESALTQVRHFWHGLAQIRRVVRPQGVIVLDTPFASRIQPQPTDYWRFTPEALDWLLEDYPQRIVGWQGSAKRPRRVWALAFGREYPAVTAAQLDLLRRNLACLGADQPSFSRRLRKGLVRLVGGRRAAESLQGSGEFGFEFRGPDFASALAA